MRGNVKCMSSFPDRLTLQKDLICMYRYSEVRNSGPSVDDGVSVCAHLYPLCFVFAFFRTHES